MTQMQTMSSVDARKLLGFSASGRTSKQAVEQAYIEKTRQWNKALNVSSTLEARQRAMDALALLHEARKICLNPRQSSRHNPAQRVSASSPAPAVSFSSSHSSPNYKPTFGKVHSSCGHFSAVFIHLWGILRETFLFALSLPGAAIEVKTCVEHRLDQLSAAGVPKGASIMILLLLFLPLFLGCAKLVHSVAGWVQTMGR